MGSLARNRAKNRFRAALKQRLPDSSSHCETNSAYDEAVTELLDIAIDVEELDKATRRLATNPDEISFPN